MNMSGLDTPLPLGKALKEAKKIAKSGEANEAISAYKQILRRFPNNREAATALKRLNLLGKGANGDANVLKLATSLYNKGSFNEIQTREKELYAAAPKNSELMNIVGAAYAAQGRYEEAIVRYRRAIETDHRSPNAYSNMGNALRARWRTEEAIDAYFAALKLEPTMGAAQKALSEMISEEVMLKNIKMGAEELISKHIDSATGYLLSGLANYQTGDWFDSINMFEKAEKRNPTDRGLRLNLASAYRRAGEYKKATKIYEKALSEPKPDPSIYYNYGNLLRFMGRPNEAIENYKLGLERKPENKLAWNNLGLAYQESGNMDEARSCFERAIQIDFNYTDAHKNRFELGKVQAKDPFLKRLLDMYSSPESKLHGDISIHFGMAKALEDTGEIDRAFQFYKKGNKLRKLALGGYDPDLEKRKMEKIKAAFLQRKVAFLSDKDTEKERPFRPIFIVGMPRSGTTLVEQILASHSQVHGAGELEYFEYGMRPFASKVTVNSEKIESFSLEDMKSIRQFYLDHAFDLGVEKPVITDKMPANFRWIGFIKAAFPEARIIHLNRNPMAIGWSLYKRNFQSDGSKFAYGLKDLAHYIRLERDLVDFWNEVFPGLVFELNYERLTEDQEGETRRLLEYCGLDWEEQCLDFSANKRSVLTASNQQIRKGLYKGSSEAWRRFGQYLDPLRQGLGEPIN